MTRDEAAAAAQKRVAESINRSAGQHRRVIAQAFAQALRRLEGRT